MSKRRKPAHWARWYEATVSLSQTVDGRPVRHLVVKRRSGRDGITWDTLQRIKNETLGPDVLAVEIYPAELEAVDEINARHLWEVPVDREDALPSLWIRARFGGPTGG